MDDEPRTVHPVERNEDPTLLEGTRRLTPVLSSYSHVTMEATYG
jgi:hypothetical protein